jgi:iron complex transport system permease protein
VVAIVICVVLSLTFGARSVSVNEIIEGLFASKDLSVGGTVVHERLPRTVFGLIAGASLGMSGSLMQAITRNPLADPGILGVNSGASLAVVCGIAFLHISNLYQYIALALIGAGLSAIFVYLVGSLGRGGATPIKLALAGAATSATLISLVSAIMLPRAANMDAFRFWQVGGIGGATWSGIATVSPLLIIGAIIAIVSCGSLNALALGDDVAAGLGVNTSRTRLIGAVAGILLCGAVTALAGPIGFVGLMIPHAIRALTGPDLRWNIPLSAGGGAVLLTAADIFGRLIGRPGEIDCGLITAFIGAPVLVYIAMKTKVKSL